MYIPHGGAFFNGFLLLSEQTHENLSKKSANRSECKLCLQDNGVNQKNGPQAVALVEEQLPIEERKRSKPVYDRTGMEFCSCFSTAGRDGVPTEFSSIFVEPMRDSD